MSFDFVQIAHEIAQKAHAGQVDKAGIDYIKHPEKVASFVHSDYEKATAYLHDTLEDTEVTAAELIQAGIPEEVVEVVELLIHDKNQDYFAYLEKVKGNPIARAVKLADLRHNSDLSRLTNISEKDRQRLEKYKKAISYLKN